MKRAFAFLVVLLLLGGAVYGLGYFHFVMKPAIIKQVIASHGPPPTTVAVTEAREEQWVPHINAIGTFKAVQGIDVAPQVGGIVKSIEFESAQEVQKGAPLIKIDDTTEQADLLSGLAQMKIADLALQRQKELMTGGNTARATLDQAQATRDTAAAAVDRAKSVIAQKTITAPFAGRLGIRKIDVGQYVSPGTALVTLTQLDPIFVDFPAPEQSLAVLQTGQTVEIKVDAFPADVFKGAIKVIDTRVAAETRSVLVRAELQNSDRRLVPGMFANVAVLAGAAKPVVTLPKTSVSYSLYGDSVYVVVPAPPPATPAPAAGEAQAAPAAEDDFIVQRRFVRTGEARADRIAVTEGLKAGDIVVSEGQIKLYPDAHVRIDRSAGLTPRAVLPKQ